MVILKCLDCGKSCPQNKRFLSKDTLRFVNHGIYLCIKCRHKIVIKEFERILKEKKCHKTYLL